MRTSQLIQEIIRRHRNADKRRVLYIQGPPGGGKSETPVQAASIMGEAYRMIHSPLLQPEDWGFPIINATKDNVSFIASRDIFPLVGDESCPDTGILVFEEVPQSGEERQKIIANVILTRKIHGQTIKPGWTIIMTGNRASDRAGAGRMLSHLKDRITVVDLDISIDDWTAWALQNNIDINLIAGLRFKSDLLSAFDAQQDKSPTPRSWSQGVNNTIQGINDGSIPADLEFELYKGDVGEAAAAEMCAFMKIARKIPHPDAIMLNPLGTHVPNINDPNDVHAGATLYALCGSLAKATTKDNFGKLMLYVTRMPGEFQMLYIKLTTGCMCKNTHGQPAITCSCGKRSFTETKEYIQWAVSEGKKILV